MSLKYEFFITRTKRETIRKLLLENGFIDYTKQRHEYEHAMTLWNADFDKALKNKNKLEIPKKDPVIESYKKDENSIGFVLFAFEDYTIMWQTIGFPISIFQKGYKLVESHIVYYALQACTEPLYRIQYHGGSDEGGVYELVIIGKDDLEYKDVLSTQREDTQEWDDYLKQFGDGVLQRLHNTLYNIVEMLGAISEFRKYY